MHIEISDILDNVGKIVIDIQDKSGKTLANSITYEYSNIENIEANKNEDMENRPKKEIPEEMNEGF